MKPSNAFIELSIETTEGKFRARYSEKGLAELRFPANESGNRRGHEEITSPLVQSWHRATTQALKRLLAGQKPDEVPPLDLSSGTDFQRQVWGELQKIGCGSTRSYSEIARAIGRPKAVRAVGGACGANPIPVLVPCHRVLAANRRLGGFSGGLHWKRALLGREGVNVR